MKKPFAALKLAVLGVLSFAVLSATPIGTLNTGSAGTVTVSLSAAVFNADPSAVGGGNSEVANGTALSFAGCSGVLGSAGCLSASEGITINNGDLTISSVLPDNMFLLFAAHPSLVFGLTSVGPGSANTNCATANANGLSCSVFTGSPIVLTYSNGDTVVGLGVNGRASDTGTGGLATGSFYVGGFSEFLTNNLPNGLAPTPQNIQLYFCPSGTCVAADFTSGKSITSSQSGTFFATTVPEPTTISLFGLGLIGLGLLQRRRARS